MPIALAACLSAPALARESLGTFDRWGAFRDRSLLRCHAIALPLAEASSGRWRPFAAIGYWPRAGVRGQINFRLSRAIDSHAPVALTIAGQRFVLTGGGADAWAVDRRQDAAIIAAMRAAPRMALSAHSSAGRPFADVYGLRGAATAIDAAALGCGRLR